MRLYDAVSCWLARHGSDGSPAPSVAGPARRAECSRAAIQGLSSSQNLVVIAGVALRRTDVANAAVTMIEVVPMDEVRGPGSSLDQGQQSPGRETRAGIWRYETATRQKRWRGWRAAGTTKV